MRGLRGVVAGVLALTFLEAVLRTPQAAGRVGGFFTGVAAAFDHLVNPSVPLIPDRRYTPSAGTQQPSGAGVAQLPAAQFTTRPSVPQFG